MFNIESLFFLLLITGAIVLALSYIVSSQVSKLRSELKNDESDVLIEWLKDMKDSVDRSSDTVEKQLGSHRDAMDKRTKLIWKQLDKSSQVIASLQQQLGGIQEFGKDMKDLSNVLKSPTLRGGLGEKFLYEILENYLPHELYSTQHRFKDGLICDAVIKSADLLIPIDSKFPTSNFSEIVNAKTDEDRKKAKRVFVTDVKKHINDISKKYILPEQGTTDQAIMYIPAENVYYEITVKTPELEEYALDKNVFFTSPNTLISFLNVLLAGHKRQELQNHAGEILKALSGIKLEAEKFNDELGVLEGHIDRTYKSISNVKTKYQKLYSHIDDVQKFEISDSSFLHEVPEDE